MSTFVVRFFSGAQGEEFRGRVRHVGSGEEVAFAGDEELLAFLKEMRTLNGVIGVPAQAEKEDPGG